MEETNGQEIPSDTAKKKKRLNWTCEDMCLAVQFAKSGELKVDECCQIFNIPKKTLKTRMSGQPIVQQLGNPQEYTDSEVDTIHIYLKQRQELGIPITQTNLQDEIQYFNQLENVKTRFKDGRPGSWWLSKFKSRVDDDLIFTTDIEKEQASKTKYTLNGWKERIEQIVKPLNSGEIPLEYRRYYIIETDELVISPDNIIETMIIYDGEGSLLCPTMMHWGETSEYLLNRFNKRLLFQSTKDGRLDLQSFLNALKTINEHCVEKKISYPVVVYTTPKVSSKYSFKGYQYCYAEELILVPIPTNIYEMIRLNNLGIYEKLAVTFAQFIQDRFTFYGFKCTVEDAPQVLCDTIRTTKNKRETLTMLKRFNMVPPKRRKSNNSLMLADQNSGDHMLPHPNNGSNDFNAHEDFTERCTNNNPYSNEPVSHEEENRFEHRLLLNDEIYRGPQEIINEQDSEIEDPTYDIKTVTIPERTLTLRTLEIQTEETDFEGHLNFVQY